MNENFSSIVSKLKAEKHGNQYLAKCPTHDDRQASLSLAEARDGTILIKCFAGCETAGIVESLGLTMAELFPPKEKPQKKEIVATYDYRDENSQLLFQAVRFNPKGFSQRQPDGQDNWLYNLRGVRRVLYRLPDLLRELKAKSRNSVFICEGEKDVDLLWNKGLLATTNPMGAGKWRDEFAEVLIGCEVIILPDNDDAGRSHAEAVAKSLQEKASAVKVIDLPGLPAKGDVTDWFNNGGDVEQLCVLAENAPLWTPRSDNDQVSEKKQPTKTKRTDFFEAILGKATLFHDSDLKPYASVEIDDHIETFSMRSMLFGLWVSRFHYELFGNTMNSDQEKDLHRSLQAEALFAGDEIEVNLRLAHHGENIYLDMVDAKWRVVEISKDGWKVIPAKEAPVKFTRRLAMLPLPEPQIGGQLDELRNYMNAGDDDTWTLIASWLVMTLHPSGPYPFLTVTGEQGSAKTTACRMLRSLVDPNKADLRSLPTDIRDLIIAASNSHLIAFDNLSGLTQEMGDALCRVATGAGFATRALHTDADEAIFSVKRPVLANGIVDIASFPDLLDRVVGIYLPAISDHQRREEKEIWSGFNLAKPRILGALCSAASTALKNQDTVKLDRRPRMADFTRWAIAAEPGMGLSEGAFFQAYDLNRKSSNEMALDTPLATELREFMENLTAPEWEGTATTLLKALNHMVANKGEVAKDKYGWPKSPNALSGKLRRIAPNLRRDGIEILSGRTNGGSRIHIVKTQK